METKEKIDGCVLAMYDVRGIQNYIYHTSKLKDAIGASQLVENIIMDALSAACKELKKEDVVLAWDNEQKVLPYNTEKHDVKVLYIGGGNAFVMFSSQDLCIEINKHMSKYIIEHTYSLQLAVAYVKVSENYSDDYKDIFDEMKKVKSYMIDSKPLGTLPIMEIEIKTGLPAIDMEKEKIKIDKYRGNISRETYLKINEKNKSNIEDDIDKILDSYARRGIDSRIAIVHIDGNNMGMRIRKLIEGIEDYEKAINKMREISHNIKYSYLNTFNKMKDKFNDKKIGDDSIKKFVRKVIVAGDDITYVCNAFIALDTVRYFCDEISKLTMNSNDKDKNKDIEEYGFSVCAGIAYVNSHFPFNIAYEVAESCCESAKKAAKDSKNKAYYKKLDKHKVDVISESDYDKKDKTHFEKTGNFVDFQICKNIQCIDLKQTREREFVTSVGELLIQRPYYIPMPFEKNALNEVNEAQPNNINNLMNNIRYFSDEKNIPRSFAKDIRNTYCMGSGQIGILASFLDSRNWKMPNNKKCEDNMYIKNDGIKIAAWYDALEIMDYCMDTTNEKSIYEEASQSGN